MNARFKNIAIFSASGILLVFLMVVLFALAPERGGKVCEAVSVRVVDDHLYQFVSEKDVRKYMDHLGINLEGMLLSEVFLDDIEKQLEEHPMLRRVVCFQNSKGNISIEVEQKVPIFRVITPTESYYVDNERMKMPVSLNHVSYVPLVSGNVNSEFASLKLYDFIVFLQDDNFISSLVEQIYVYPNHEIEITPRVGKFKILLGPLDRYETKIEKLKTFYKKVLPEVGWDKYSKINLEFVDQVVCTTN